jgi:hypothetical protein
MADVELKSFLEDRLTALDPSLDLSPGSPAQTKFIDPVLQYLGTDPFETDIDAFLTDRFAQEFPDIYASDPGIIRDTFVKPLSVILEPFKRETQSIKRNQSLIDPSQLSDDDADALVANVFDSRDQGGFAVGTGRLYFPNPTDVRIELGHRAYSSSNLNFFPTNPLTVSAESMVFSRDGTLYYVDVPLRAEKAGDEYNLDVGELTGFDGVAGIVKVTNLRKFTGGSARQDTTTFVQAAEQSLTERSLTTRRGAAARLSTVFKGSVRAVQVIGAKDPEMQRDYLVASTPGHAWITGKVELYEQIAYVRARTVDGDESVGPAVGDTLYVYVPSLAQNLRFLRLTIDEVLFANRGLPPGEFRLAYLVRWSGLEEALSEVIKDKAARDAFIADFFSSMPTSYEGGFSKKPYVKVTSTPDAQNIDAETLSGKVHVFGRSDIYVRPATQSVSQAVVSGAYDLGKVGSTPNNPHFYWERITLSTTGASNRVADTGMDFAGAGVENGDFISVEDGPDAGLYTIRDMVGDTLYLSQQLTATKTGVRYRILKKIRLNPFETRIMRFPFGDVVQNDLQTTIGSKLVTTGSTDLLKYGARTGDTLRILSGPDAGDYIIQSFDPTLGGQGVNLDRALTATSFDLAFEVFTPQDSLQRPLVRVREILLLDSAKQSTGLTVPAADPVAVVPTGPLTSARVLGASQLSSGFVLPDLASLVTFGNTAAASAPGNDRRYSLGFDPTTGVHVPFLFNDATQAEIDVRADAQGKTSYFVATTEVVSDQENTPPVDPKPGDSLCIKNGPNAGSYLVQAVHKFKYRQAGSGPTRTNWVYFIQIYGTFPVDPLLQIIEFLRAHAVGGETGLESLAFPLSFPDYFQSWFSTLGGRLYDALINSGVNSPPDVELQAAVEAMHNCFYEWGTPARGVLRSYFREPTLFEQWTGSSNKVTEYITETATGETVSFRPDPIRYTQQQLIPARVAADADPKDFPRDLDASGPTPIFTDSSKLSIFSAGVVAGDYLSVHEETFVYGGGKLLQAVVTTEAGSNTITVPEGVDAVFDPSMVGDLLFLEEGDDKGGYRVVQVLDARRAVLDRVLQTSTPPAVKSGTSASLISDGDNKITAGLGGRPFTDADVGSYITLFALDYRMMGSFAITEVLDKDLSGNGTAVKVTSTTPFPTSTVSGVQWAIAPLGDLPPPTPVQRDPHVPSFGTECVTFIPIRIYESETSDYKFLSVVNDSSISSGLVDGDVRDGISQPYEIYRSNVRRITPTEMDGSRDGFLCFFDTEVVSLSPTAESNIPQDSYLVAKTGTYSSLGYRHAVEDPNFTYSMKEEGFLDLPLTILPIGSPDSPDSMVRVVGAPIQLSYERADLVALVQDFIESPDDRVLAAGFLARHFLPAYVSYDATYEGGADPAVVAKAIRAYLDQLPVEGAVDVSEIENLISQNGGNPDTPTKVSATIYDWDRKMWVEFTENEFGGPLPTDTKVPYNGSPRVTYFVPGPDVSGATSPPSGERINLTRR